MANAVLQLSTSNLIGAYQNETCLWDTTKNSTEEENELAWSRLSGPVAPTPLKFKCHLNIDLSGT